MQTVNPAKAGIQAGLTRDQKLETRDFISSVPSWFRIIRSVTLCIFLVGGSVWIVSPLISDIYFRKGKDFNKTGYIEDAMTSFETAARWSDHGDAEYNLGDLLMKQNKIDEALTVYQLSAKQRKDKYIYNALANVYFFKKDYNKAIYFWKQLADRDPYNPQYWDFLWIAYIRLGNDKLANEAHEKAQQLKMLNNPIKSR